MNRATSDRRLLKLADFLDELPEDRFDYSQWVGEDWGGKPDLSCGTTACALGWAAAMPEFRRLGLRLERVRYGGLELPAGIITNKRLGAPDSSIHAAEVTFGLSAEESIYLFSPDTHLENGPGGGAVRGLPLSPERTASPAEVADHIRSFVEYRAEGEA